jgi:hypothetical protein
MVDKQIQIIGFDIEEPLYTVPEKSPDYIFDHPVSPYLDCRVILSANPQSVIQTRVTYIAMNGRRVLLWLCVWAAVVWASWVLLCRAPHLFRQVRVNDLFGVNWLPMWASLTTHVQPYADPTLGTHPIPPGTQLAPSTALIIARFADTLLDIILLPACFLLSWHVGRWIVMGFRSTLISRDFVRR